MKQLAPYPLIRPGFKGLNTEKAADTTIGGAFALTLTNAVFDKAGRIAARKGWVSQHPLGVGGSGDPYFDDVVLLLHGEGANAGTVLTDSSSFAHSLSQPFGGITTSTSQAKVGSSAIKLTGTSMLRAAWASEFDVSAGNDFTVETWIYLDSSFIGVQTENILLIGNGTSRWPINFAFNTSGHLSAAGVDSSGSDVYNLVGTTVASLNTWYHVALVRKNHVYTIYLNGVAEATSTSSTALAAGTTFVDVGAYQPSAYYTSGYIDELRFTNGFARYDGNFTPSTDPFPSNGPVIASAVAVMHEWVQSNGSTDVITAGDNKLFQGITLPVNRTGSLTPTGDDWQFVNFRGYVLGFQQGNASIIFTGNGSFKDIVETNGSAPNGNCAVAAFGRVWAVDSDKQTIKYCALLDPYDWGSSDAGLIDMRTIWTKGMDEVVGITAFGASLVVFGKRHIILWTDGQGSLEGMDPLTMYVADTIEGTGLAARDSIQSVGTGDVIYLSPTGLQSLARIIVNKNNPLQSIDGSVSRYLRGYTSSEDPRKIRSLYNARDEFYLLILPKSGVSFCFSTREPLEDGSLRVSEWDDISPLCGVARLNGNVLLGFPNYYGKYAGYLDNGATYTLSYRSPWMTLADLNPELEFRNKIPKRIGASIYTGETTDITYEWGFDFDTIPAETLSVALTNNGRFTEYGQGEYGANGVYDVSDPAAVAGVDVAEYGGSLTLSLDHQEMSGDGRWIQFGLDAVINDAEFTIQQLDLYCKVGAGIR